MLPNESGMERKAQTDRMEGDIRSQTSCGFSDSLCPTDRQGRDTGLIHRGSLRYAVESWKWTAATSCLSQGDPKEHPWGFSWWSSG